MKTFLNWVESKEINLNEAVLNRYRFRIPRNASNPKCRTPEGKAKFAYVTAASEEEARERAADYLYNFCGLKNREIIEDYLSAGRNNLVKAKPYEKIKSKEKYALRRIGFKDLIDQLTDIVASGNKNELNVLLDIEAVNSLLKGLAEGHLENAIKNSLNKRGKTPSVQWKTAELSAIRKVLNDPKNAYLINLDAYEASAKSSYEKLSRYYDEDKLQDLKDTQEQNREFVAENEELMNHPVVQKYLMAESPYTTKRLERERKQQESPETVRSRQKISPPPPGINPNKPEWLQSAETFLQYKYPNLMDSINNAFTGGRMDVYGEKLSKGEFIKRYFFPEGQENANELKEFALSWLSRVNKPVS